MNEVTLITQECGAKARQNNYQPCQRVAMANGKCYLHGGLTPKHNLGPKTEAGRLRQRMAKWKHGLRSQEALAERRNIREYLSQSKKLLEDVLRM